MEDGDSKNDLEKNIFRKHFSETADARDVFQPFWVRHNSILSIITDRRFVERKFNFIWIVGIVFWVGFFASKIF